MRSHSSAHVWRLGALLCLTQAPAFASGANDTTPDVWEASLRLGQRRLYEEADNGQRLLTERGPLAGVDVGGRLRLGSQASLRGRLALRAADLDYDGRTQQGAPLKTSSEHREIDAALLWSPWGMASWGELSMGGRSVYQRREIASIGRVLGLTETSTLLMPGLHWSGPPLSVASWSWQPSAAIWSSVRHRLRVDYQGAFDDSRLTGARRTELVLGLTARPVDSPWRFSAEWTRARQPASDREPLYRAGVQVGTVRQPRLGFDDVTLSVGRSF